MAFRTKELSNILGKLCREHWPLRMNLLCRCMATETKKCLEIRDSGRLPQSKPQVETHTADVEFAHAELRNAMQKMEATVLNVPCIVGNEIHLTGSHQTQKIPHQHDRTLATFAHADTQLINQAIDTAREARELWSRVEAAQRSKIWLRCANILEAEDNYLLIAAMVLGQSTTPALAQRDVRHLIVDMRRTAKLLNYMASLKFKQQDDAPHIYSTFHLRPLNGFVAAISPFNSICLAATLALHPALMGNAVVWQPHDNAILSNYIVYQAMLKAGLPPSVISFVPCSSIKFAEEIIKSSQLAGINYAGHSSNLRAFWRAVGSNIMEYNCFPRICGECFGKNFHFAHASADPIELARATIGSAFEYAGQQLSSCSRLYCPSSIWDEVREHLMYGCKSLLLGAPTHSHVPAMINREACENAASYIFYARMRKDLSLLCGGDTDMQTGYFTEPTIIQCYDPRHMLMSADIPGPVLCVYVYPDDDAQEVMRSIVETTKLALSGSIFGRDGTAVLEAMRSLRMVASNLYINERSTGPSSICNGNQLSRFSGTGFAGTNDKSSLTHTLMNWCMPQLVEQNIATKVNLKKKTENSNTDTEYGDVKL